MKLKNLPFPLLLLFLVLTSGSFAQEDIQIGKSANEFNRYYGALYDYSKADAINIKVMVWGYVRYPGQYIVPSPTDVNQLLSLAGGPTPDASLDEMKIFRVNADKRQTIIAFNYSDLLSGDPGLGRPIKIPDLKPGDILLIPGSPKWYAKDYLSIILSIVSVLASVATFIVYSRK
jgi:SLBB domain